MVRLQPRFERDGNSNKDVRANGRDQSLEGFKGNGGGIGGLQTAHREKRETVHLLASCKVLAGNEYLSRRKNALMVLAEGG